MNATERISAIFANKMLTRGLVAEAAELIRSEADDDECAHVQEDWLHQYVLTWIADGSVDGSDDLAGLAKEALRTREIKFSRWCA